MKRAVLDTPVLPVKFVPASVVSLDGFLLIRRMAKRKCARTFENSDIGSSDDLGGVGSFSPGSGNVDNCAVNDCNTASSKNGETVDIIIGGVNSASNNIAMLVTAVLRVTTLPVSMIIVEITILVALSLTIPILLMLIALMAIMLVVIVIVLLITVVITIMIVARMVMVTVLKLTMIPVSLVILL